jgi:hypothetical protein
MAPTNGKLSDAQIKSDEFLGALFQRSVGPIGFDEVVRIAAETWQIHDAPIESIDTNETESDRQFTSSEPKVDLALEQRLFFEQVWREVCQLPVLQRAALLLNLRDSRDGGVISFLPFLGVASKEELARLLEMSQEDFQELWNELPLDDSRIAQMFGITRQQVINLRKSPFSSKRAFTIFWSARSLRRATAPASRHSRMCLAVSRTPAQLSRHLFH